MTLETELSHLTLPESRNVPPPDPFPLGLEGTWFLYCT